MDGSLHLDTGDRELLDGGRGEAASIAMRFVVLLAEAVGADRLIDVTKAHIDGCLYHGQAGLEFAERLAAAGAEVAVPTTLNVGSLDLLHPELYRGDKETARRARRLMDAYVEMGCRPTWTCAPYQLEDPPGFGEQIAWGESNAIVYANSVLGARTERYGDFIDICAAITGRVPAYGLHLTENRGADVVVDVSRIPAALRDRDVLFPLLGHVIGQLVPSGVPLVVGLERATPDQLKALGAGAASSGGIGLFHVAGITPESALPGFGGDRDPARPPVAVTVQMLRDARDELTTGPTAARLGAVALGTPHASPNELRRLAALLEGRRVASGIECYVSSGRDVLGSEPAAVAALERAGVQIVADTCTYVTPIIGRLDGVVMTDSAKWAYYAPANIGAQVVFGSTEDCVASAVTGEIVRDEELWGA